MDKIIITTFTDPMMGLSYECEPIFRKLETHFKNQLEFHYVMAGLVRDVSDFMLSSELALPEKEGIEKYNQRLAKIYKSEEQIANMPINMENFNLFDKNHRSSYPLNIAYKAAQLANPEKADLYLYRLRYATIVETRKTTLDEELSNIAKESGIDEKIFKLYFFNGKAEEEFKKDLFYCQSLGIYSLPSYLLQYKEKNILVKQLIGYEDFIKLFYKLSEGKIKALSVDNSVLEIKEFIKKHCLISPLELKYAFDFNDFSFLESLKNDIQIIKVGKGNYFIKSNY